MKKIKELKSRWLTDEGQKKVQIIIDTLKKKSKLSDLTFLETYDGRIDLRGIQLSTLDKEIKISSGNHSVIQKYGTLKLKKNLLSSVDFSYSDICYSSFKKMTFENCIFENTKAIELRITASHFNNCIFKKTNLFYSYINKNIFNDSGSFNNCDFIESNLSKCIFYFPVINNCRFIDCDLDETNFNGSRFSNTKFSGLLDSIWFRGYARNVMCNSIYSMFKKKNKNPMLNVNFEDAILKGISFAGGIDLRNCIFPENDNYIFLKDTHATFKRAKDYIVKHWKDEEEIRKVIAYIDAIYLTPDKMEQNNDFIDKFILTDDGKGNEFGETFFNLIKACND